MFTGHKGIHQEYNKGAKHHHIEADEDPFDPWLINDPDPRVGRVVWARICLEETVSPMEVVIIDSNFSGGFLNPFPMRVHLMED